MPNESRTYGDVIGAIRERVGKEVVAVMRSAPAGDHVRLRGCLKHVVAISDEGILLHVGDCAAILHLHQLDASPVAHRYLGADGFVRVIYENGAEFWLFERDTEV